MTAGKKIILILDLLILIAIMIHTVTRDLALEKNYPGDLRNRVVGARLQEDGRLPYFYKWKSADGYRYWDLQNNDSLKVANITASPFFHDLLIPICDLPQRDISRIWMWFQYLLLTVMAIFFITLSKNYFQKITVVNTAVIFTCTEAWKSLIAEGQLYLFIAFLICCIMYALLRRDKGVNMVIAGVCAALLVLVRPNALVIFVPFVLQFRKNYKFLLSSAICLMIYGTFLLFNAGEKKLWVDYYKGLQEQVRLHQGMSMVHQNNETVPDLPELEGFNFAQIKRDSASQVRVYTENGNVFLVYELLTHKKISAPVFTAIFAICIALLSIVFIVFDKKYGIELYYTLMLSAIFYMMADLFSPVLRHQFYTVQWLPLLFLLALRIENIPKICIVLLITGMLLNIINTTILPMRHTIGEYLWLLSFLLIFLFQYVNRRAWKLQS